MGARLCRGSFPRSRNRDRPPRHRRQSSRRPTGPSTDGQQCSAHTARGLRELREQRSKRRATAAATATATADYEHDYDSDYDGCAARWRSNIGAGGFSPVDRAEHAKSTASVKSTNPGRGEAARPIRVVVGHWGNSLRNFRASPPIRPLCGLPSLEFSMRPIKQCGYRQYGDPPRAASRLGDAPQRIRLEKVRRAGSLSACKWL